MAVPRFKPCAQHQPMLLPPSVEELIPDNALVRVVDSIVDGMGRSLLESTCPGGGAPAHDPSTMLKAVLLCCAGGIYSSRKIAAATRENVSLMWLTGMRPPDHSTVNRFRSERIRPVFEDVFSEVIAVLADAGHITLDTYFLDGTKTEADANKFTFVWKRSTDRHQDALRRKVHAHLEAIDEMNDEEEAHTPEDPSEVDADAIRDAADGINEGLKARREAGEGKDAEAKELKKAAGAIERDYLPRMDRYERQQAAFAGRKSLSKTDPDATFMRMKDDAMGNGQLKAGYTCRPAPRTSSSSTPPCTSAPATPRAPSRAASTSRRGSGTSPPSSWRTQATAARRTTPTSRGRASTPTSSTASSSASAGTRSGARTR